MLLLYKSLKQEKCRNKNEELADEINQKMNLDNKSKSNKQKEKTEKKILFFKYIYIYGLL